MDINEILLTAMDTLVSKRLQSINYDNTGVYTITDAKYAEQGKYTVSNGVVSFVAYGSNPSYRVNDVVYVTIPNNDFNQQKIIIGKQVSDDTAPFVFTNPFDTLLDVSSNLITTATNEQGLVANEPNSTENPNATEIVIWRKDYTNQELAGFTRLGIQGNFKSWLDEFDTVEGDYGLKLVLKCEKDNKASINLVYKKIYNLLDVNKLTQTEWNWIKNSSKLSWKDCTVFDPLTWDNYNTKSTEEKVAILTAVKQYITNRLLDSCEKYEFYLSSNDMYGNPYNFESFYQQQVVFDISNLGKILEMELSFYQVPYQIINGVDHIGFIDKFNNPIPYTGDFGERLLPNIFEKDPYICVGYDLSYFDKEQAILYSLNSTTYKADSALTEEELTKQVQLRWLHDFGDPAGILPVDVDTDLDYSIYWYRYSLGASTPDGYAGVNWKKVNKVIEETVSFDNIENRPSMHFYMHPRLCSWENGSSYVERFDIASYKEYLPEKYKAFYEGVSDPISTNAANPSISFSHPVDDPWTDIYDYEFIYHPDVRDIHRLGFWEKVTTAFRFYWLYPVEFKKLGCSKIWETGGSYTSLREFFDSEEEYNEYADYSNDWLSWKGLRLYDIEVSDSQGDRILLPAQLTYRSNEVLTDGTGAKFNLNSSAGAITKILRAFTDSFGKWVLTTDAHGLKNFVPENPEVYALLQTETRLLFEKLESKSIITEIEKDFSYTFIPDIEEPQEMIKAIVVCGGQPIYSNILTFNNESEVSNKATVDKTNGLNLWCVDDSFGNYFIYEQGGGVIDTDQALRIRDLECHFDSDLYECTGLLQEATYIEWHIPLVGTMLTLDFSDNSIPKIDYAHPGENLPVYRNYTQIEEEEQDKLRTLAEGRELSATQKAQGWHLQSYSLPYEDNGIVNTFTGYWSKPMYHRDAEAGLEEVVIIWKGDEEYGYRINPCLEYSIKSFYSQSYTNNTISCIIEKDKVTYSAAKEFTFGPAGTSGTDATLVLDFEHNEHALTVFGSQSEYDQADVFDHPSVTVIAKLYDSSNQEIDFRNIDNGNLKFTWEWFKTKPEDELINPAGITIQPAATGSTIVTEGNMTVLSTTYNNAEPNRISFGNLDKLISDNCMNTLLYLKVTVSGWGDYDLSAILPIALRRYNKNKKYNYITGATSVVYPVNGYPIYYTNKYEMHLADGSYGSGHWYIFNPYDARDSYKQYIGSIGDNRGTPTDILKPAAVYIADTKQYGVQYKENGNVFWTQPIWTCQNQYGSKTINQWDGKSIDINEDHGTIVSRGIAAGKKDSENRFSGVMLGDWSTTDVESDIDDCTGVFGFNKGAMSYAITDDGKAFFGKSGAGRILLDGEKSTITSASFDKLDEPGPGVKIDLDSSPYLQIKGHPINKDTNEIDDSVVNYIMNIQDGKGSSYLQSANYEKTEDASGLHIDLNKGSIKAKGEFELVGGDNIYISTYGTDSKPYFRIKDNCNPKHILINMSNNDYYLQSCGFSDTNQQGIKISLTEGTITAYDFLLKAGKDNKKIIINSNADEDNGAPFSVGNDFKVYWDSDVDMGSWHVEMTDRSDTDSEGNHWSALWTEAKNQNTNQSYYMCLDASRDNVLAIGIPSENFFTKVPNPNFNYAKFRVTYDGKLYCTEGQLGCSPGNGPTDGWNITTNTIYSKGMSGTVDENGNYNLTASDSEADTFKLSTVSFDRSINGVSRSDLRLAIGSKFAVNGAGYLFADTARLTNIVVSGGTLTIGDIKISSTAITAGQQFKVTSSGEFQCGAVTIGSGANGWNILKIGEVHLSQGEHSLLHINTGLVLKTSLNLEQGGYIRFYDNGATIAAKQAKLLWAACESWADEAHASNARYAYFA